MSHTLPTTPDERKAVPLASGVLDYFPAALAYVAKVSKAGNDKHNPGEPMHHARGKSMDHADCIMRHLVDRGSVDPEDKLRHSGKVAWRALAMLQEELEREEGAPLARGAREPGPAPVKIFVSDGVNPGRFETHYPKVPPPVQDFLKYAIPCSGTGAASSPKVVEGCVWGQKLTPGPALHGTFYGTPPGGLIRTK